MPGIRSLWERINPKDRMPKLKIALKEHTKKVVTTEEICIDS